MYWNNKPKKEKVLGLVEIEYKDEKAVFASKPRSIKSAWPIVFITKICSLTGTLPKREV